MISSTMVRFIAIFSILCMASTALGATTIYNVMSYGAAGNGIADDSQAFLRAWGAACQEHTLSTTPVFYVPANRMFLLNPLTFNGPCRAPRIYILVSGNLTAPTRSGWVGSNQANAWILFASVNGLVIKGKGVLDGQGSSWWPTTPCIDDPEHGVVCKGPTGIIFRRCDGLRLDGFSIINGPGSHMLITATNDVVVYNIRIISPGDSLYTDGISISSSTNVKIRNCMIGTGDDCIAVRAGSSNIDISGITCGPGHGISIGSLGRGGNDVVENVRVRNSTFEQTVNGVRIKTLQGGHGYARNITFEGIRFVAVENPIHIDQFYCPLEVNCQNYTSTVALSDISFRGMLGTSIAESAINLMCSQSVGCTNIRLDRVYITPSIPGNNVYATCNNAHGIATHTKPSIRCLQA